MKKTTLSKIKDHKEKFKLSKRGSTFYTKVKKVKDGGKTKVVITSVNSGLSYTKRLSTVVYVL